MRQPNDRAVEALHDSILAEKREDPDRRAVYDRDGTRGKKQELLDYAAATEPKLVRIDEHGKPVADPQLKVRLKVYLAVIATGFVALDNTVDAYNRAVSRGQRYSAEARDAARAVHGFLTKIRARADKRLGEKEQAQAAKKGFGVGDNLNPESVMDLRDRAVTALATLQAKDYAELFAAREFDATLFARELSPALDRLKAEIARGVGHETKKGEGSEDINDALLYLEIAFARLLAFLEDHGCAEEAATLDSRIPRRHRPRAKKKAEEKKDEKKAGEEQKSLPKGKSGEEKKSADGTDQQQQHQQQQSAAAPA